jgi:hypothetical protein
MRTLDTYQAASRQQDDNATALILLSLPSRDNIRTQYIGGDDPRSSPHKPERNAGIPAHAGEVGKSRFPRHHPTRWLDTLTRVYGCSGPSIQPVAVLGVAEPGSDSRIARFFGDFRGSRVVKVLRPGFDEISKVDAPVLIGHLSDPFRARSSVVEHLTFNQRVDGSIPSGLTNFKYVAVRKHYKAR